MFFLWCFRVDRNNAGGVIRACFLSAIFMHRANRKTKSGMFGIVGLGDYSGLLKIKSRQNTLIAAKVIGV